MNATLLSGTLLCLTLLAPAVPSPARAENRGTLQEPRTGRPVGSVPEIRPGLLQGYLTGEQRLDSRRFLPPPPAPDSIRQVFDDAWGWEMLKLQSTPRWALAARDAELAFPRAASVFTCALGIAVNEEHTPALVRLLRRSLTDLGLSTYAAKNAYQRQRPFMVTATPICTPKEAAKLRGDGSYPSGHAAIGWGWALILAELLPERAEAILARGIAFGDSRNVCNVHWASDVEAGRLVGAAAVARLHRNPEFLADLQAARTEIGQVRGQGLAPEQDCAAERLALTGGLEPVR